MRAASLIGSLAALLVAGGTSVSSAAAAPPERHVILITIDGFAAYHLDNPLLVLPNLRALIAQGVRAESSQTVFPSLTHPSHTSIVTGVDPKVHGVLGNNLWDRKTGRKLAAGDQPHSQVVRVPTLFDFAHRAGLSTAAFAWPESKQDPAIDDNIPDGGVPSGTDLSAYEQTGHPLRLDKSYHHDPAYQATLDQMLAEAAANLIRRKRPGFVAIHFLQTDVVQHLYGPEHPLSQAAMTTVDRHIGLLREAVHAAGLDPSTTFVVAADHGFHTVTQEINLRAPFAEAGLLGKVRLTPDKWVLHVCRTSAFQPDDEERLQAVLHRIAALPGIARVVPSTEYPSLGFPRYEDDEHVRGQWMIIANLEYHLVDDGAGTSTGPRAKKKPYYGHGYLPTNPRMFPALILSGAGIARGKTIGHVSNLDIAPTIAHLLQIPCNNGPGRILTEALVEHSALISDEAANASSPAHKRRPQE